MRCAPFPSLAASDIVREDGGSSEDLHCYEAMLAKGALSPPDAGSVPSVAGIPFAGASG